MCVGIVEFILGFIIYKSRNTRGGCGMVFLAIIALFALMLLLIAMSGRKE